MPYHGTELITGPPTFLRRSAPAPASATAAAVTGGNRARLGRPAAARHYATLALKLMAPSIGRHVLTESSGGAFIIFGPLNYSARFGKIEVGGTGFTYFEEKSVPITSKLI